MSHSDSSAFHSLAPAIKDARTRFLDLIEPHRPELFRYARGLTGSLWDAEDLAQDAIVRAFEHLGRFSGEITNPRGFLLRIATNLWIDRWRRRGPPVHDAADVPEDGLAEGREPLGLEIREALERIAVALPPRERAVVLLAEVFDLSSREIARALATTVAAAKAALHRGRSALVRARGEAPTPRQAARQPPSDLLDAFVQAFQARDIGRLLGLLDADATVDLVGCYLDQGTEASRTVLRHTWADEFLRDLTVAEIEGEPCIVLLYDPRVETRGTDGDASASDGASGDTAPLAVGDLVRLRGIGRRVTKTRWYYFSPEVLDAVANTLGRPARTNGHR